MTDNSIKEEVRGDKEKVDMKQSKKFTIKTQSQQHAKIDHRVIVETQ